MKFYFTFLLFTLTSFSFASDTSKLLELEKNNIKIYQSSASSVVNVTNIKKAKHWIYGSVEIPAGAGSGFVWDNNGHIITNYHVIDGGDEFLVTFQKDQTQYEATLVGGEPRKDIAVLKLKKKPKNLTPIKAGVSADLQVGQIVMAIGNPFALDHTLTTGIVSATGRKIDGYGGVKIHDMIQTDASINPGNSGGPLLNSSGELIGMNTMIFSQSGSSAGLGFAVPVDTISKIVPQLIQFGKVIRPGLGVTLVQDDIKENYGIEKGVVIQSILHDGPAEKAKLEGIKQDRFGRIYLGDIILKIDTTEINSLDDLYHLLEKYKAGDTVQLEFKRNGKLKKISLKLEAV